MSLGCELSTAGRAPPVLALAPPVLALAPPVLAPLSCFDAAEHPTPAKAINSSAVAVSIVTRILDLN